jgi:hypothetical protein
LNGQFVASGTEKVEPPFRWDFGKHLGRTLDETPAEYVQWAIHLHLFDHRPDLQQALVDNGYEIRDGYDDDEDDDDEDPGFDRNLWIVPHHASRYFGVRANDMVMGKYPKDERGYWMLVDVVACALVVLEKDDAQIARGIEEFLQHIRRS